MSRGHVGELLSIGDYAEILDGVPSQHDGKGPVVLAELVCASGERRVARCRVGQPVDCRIQRGWWFGSWDVCEDGSSLGLRLLG